MVKDRIINSSISFAKAEIRYNTYREQLVKTLLITLERRHHVLSTREGFKDVTFIANHYSPRPLWDYLHSHHAIYDRWVHDCLGINPVDVTLLYTGADIDNLAVRSETNNDLTVCCLVTAGARGNVQRAGVDIAGAPRVGYQEDIDPGTVNIILLCSRALSDGAMARAIISTTEAKTAAFQDLMIKSTYTPQNQATGTGTDNTIIIGGEGIALDSSGGHTKLGELISKVTRKAVIEALVKQDNMDLSAYSTLKE